MNPRALFASIALAVPLAVTAAAPSGKATLKNAAGDSVGTAKFTQTKGGVKIFIDVAGLPPGNHGIHIHAAGKCEPPDFKTAGAHFNPSGKKHGLESPEGAHAGDLRNLVVAQDGRAKATFTANALTLTKGKGYLFGPDGTALVIHADPDDERTDPSGSSGARIACGVIEKQ